MPGAAILALTILAVAAALAAAVALGLWWLRRSLTPTRLTHPPPVRPGEPTPQQVRLPTVRGRSLNAWWLPQPCTPLQPAPTMVLLPESRNHGQSDADTFSSLPRFAEDLDAALDWAEHQPGADAQQLFALGHSVGAAAALLSASTSTSGPHRARHPAGCTRQA